MPRKPEKLNIQTPFGETSVLYFGDVSVGAFVTENHIPDTESLTSALEEVRRERFPDSNMSMCPILEEDETHCSLRASAVFIEPAPALEDPD